MRFKRLPNWVLPLVICFVWLQGNAQHRPERVVPDSITAGYQRDKVYGYANDPAYWVKQQSSEPGAFEKFIVRLFNPKIWKIIGYSFLLALFIFVVYRLFANGVFYANRKKLTVENDIQEDVTMQDEQALQALLPDLVVEKKYRDAIRVQYLLLLKHMETRSKLKLDARSTNIEYLAQLGNDKTSDPFRQLLRMYEYAWFGEIALSDYDYVYASIRFNEFKQRF